MDELALLRFPDDLLIQKLAAALAERLDDLRPVVEIVPELPRVELMQLLLGITQEFAQSGIVENEPPFLIDEAQPGRAVF